MATPKTRGIPVVFQEIIKNDTARWEILALGDTMTQSDWCTLKELNNDKKRSLRPAAVNLLRKNNM